MSSTKFIYYFSKNRSEGNKNMKEQLGGKGANLAEMAKIGIPIPPGFTIIADVCQMYEKNNKKIPQEVMDQVKIELVNLEKEMKKKLGDPANPLLVSVRSGAAISMPGMMDTVLNLGLNQETLQGLIKLTNNERFGWDSYRRFISMFGSIVMDVEGSEFEKIITKAKQTKNVKNDIDLDVNDLKKLCDDYKGLIKAKKQQEFPENVCQQLEMAIEAVFRSWGNPRAVSYRKINSIFGLKGTAVNVQSMVYGNMGETSGTGVAFTRNPNTGENVVFGELLMNAQGEDVVAGIRTPFKIQDLEKFNKKNWEEFNEINHKLEQHYKDMMDVEFTIQEGILYFLQCRTGKRSAHAALVMAVDMVQEKLVTIEEALLRIEPLQLNQLLHPQISEEAEKKAIFLGKGLAASPGAAVGQIVFNAERAKQWVANGKKVILVRQETSPNDIEGMHVASGILTSRGGMTSHAAVVCRGMGKCCVCGCEDIQEIDDEHNFYMKIANKTFKEGDWITIVGTTGKVYEGQLPTIDADIKGEAFAKIMEWSDKIRVLKIRTNADTPADTKKAVQFGAEGIGLCRTEHMFFAADRIQIMREMILSNTLQERQVALDKLFKFQKEDFIQLFKIMGNRPVTIRLLDPPLHEFLPHEEKDIIEISKQMKVEAEKLRLKCEELKECNPMLGWRGCRLGISFPEITEMQTRAILEAALETGVLAEIMVPLVGFQNELKHQKLVISRIAEEVSKQKNNGKPINYQFGTMIEVPRGAIVADQLAIDAEFFSFGTNDLTQMTCGLSRDDAGKFLKGYVDTNIIEVDPFTRIDRDGVGFLMKLAVQGGRKTRNHMKIGICGEHGGETKSIEFCHLLGLDYVSCSPFRIPIARLAAAQAAIRFKHGSLIQ